MFDDLLASIKNEELLSVYTDVENTDTFSAGFLQAISEGFLLLSHVTPYGMYDGYLVKISNNVYRIERDGKYENILTKLYTYKQQKHEKVDIIENNIVRSILYLAKARGYFVTMQLLESGYENIQGKIIDVGEVLTILQYDNYGEENGEAVINILSISELYCDTEKEQTLKLLSVI